jgi:hypothetical protein
VDSWSAVTGRYFKKYGRTKNHDPGVLYQGHPTRCSCRYPASAITLKYGGTQGVSRWFLCMTPPHVILLTHTNPHEHLPATACLAHVCRLLCFMHQSEPWKPSVWCCPVQVASYIWHVTARIYRSSCDVSVHFALQGVHVTALVWASYAMQQLCWCTMHPCTQLVSATAPLQLDAVPASAPTLQMTWMSSDALTPELR